MTTVCVRLLWSSIEECFNIDKCIEAMSLVEVVLRNHDARINKESLGVVINGKPGKLSDKICEDALIVVFRVFKGG